ncbi:hypothetical protein FOMA001_g360 [Fusarium oxysporum f. sp. matthiolae]|nr:hypothetical protein FOMA001_g360 [Fusarium oxysporum f. sp. matthiolae]
MSKTITAVRKKNDQQVRMYAAGGGDSSCHIPSLTNLKRDSFPDDKAHKRRTGR